ncbi:MAG: helix-turn-helix domain-containing protein [Brevundimonas aurantiaca]|uniref:helix-turn-helix domain-containing protein n=1 Tax=Brevundimonas aurantiaca TaxID=74316 RepID=UPI0040344E8B
MVDEEIHPIDKYVGNQLRLKRLARGVNQTELGKALKVSFQQVQKYESGANRISMSKLWLACDLLKAKPQDFFPDPAGEDDIEDIVPESIDRLGLGRAAAGLTLDRQRLVLELIRTLAGRREVDDN